MKDADLGITKEIDARIKYLLLQERKRHINVEIQHTINDIIYYIIKLVKDREFFELKDVEFEINPEVRAVKNKDEIIRMFEGCICRICISDEHEEVYAKTEWAINYMRMLEKYILTER